MSQCKEHDCDKLKCHNPNEKLPNSDTWIGENLLP